ncbi:MAG: phosphotransferase [Asticcacaulis sp.]|uniref:N-acetylmuramate/N-acetylglucosamine kinase AmgK n=1 Tax=Asticcacaulis sp. TaxID=1872648 RepID=UPI0039E24E68
MSDREALKQSFLTTHGFGDAERHPLPGDASTRRYERLIRTDGRRFMLMDQPPTGAVPCAPGDTVDERCTKGYFALARLSGGRLEAFVAVAQYLRGQGLSAPEIIAADTANGLLISEDLGDNLFVSLIEKGEAEAPLYLAAIEVQAKLHETSPPDILAGGWPLLVYDGLALKTGADVFTEWYPQYDRSISLNDQALTEWEGLWAPRRKRAEAGANVFIHRDFHAENLIWLPQRDGVARVGLIDFQDALRAHPSWDLLSLLQDARRDVSPALETLCLEHYFALRRHVDRADFMHDYNALATLNAARILGVFARLVTRDGKPKYEAFIPRMWGHLKRNLAAEGMADLRDWFMRNGFGDYL